MDVTEAIARGLADIALGKFGPNGFSGLTQAEANLQIQKLSGDIEEFFRPILGDERAS